MYTLSDKQIDFIFNDIGARGVKIEDLQLNLLDHVCCIIENELEENGNFEQFYRETISSFYKKNLKELEEETQLLLTFKNYYTMKKIMIISGITSIVLFLSGSFFKIMHWPGASPLLILGIITLSLFFLPLLFLLKSKEVNKGRDKLIIGAAVMVGILYSLSTLFAIMYWPGRTTLWILTTIVSMFVLVPLYFFRGIKNPETKINTIVTTILLVGGTGLLFTMINLKPSYAIENMTIQANKKLDQTMLFTTRQNANTYLVIKDSSGRSAQLQANSDTICRRIEHIKTLLVNAIEGRKDTCVNYANITPSMLSNYDIPSDILFNDGVPSPEISQLKTRLTDYNNFIKRSFHKDSFGMLIISSGNNHLSDGCLTWEKANFYRIPFGHLLRVLTQMQLDIRIVESTCQKSI
ncbi:MAG: hypothetical protein JWO32_3167 [Bacteroidetes bacterium]|nr:hypothetical protein [Bacteroidota bacterium]